jgi:hypothetical protein
MDKVALGQFFLRTSVSHANSYSTAALYSLTILLSMLYHLDTDSVIK